MNFTGKVVIVTGGAAGIGESCVEEFLKVGVKGVTIADVNITVGEALSKKLNVQHGDGKTIFVKTDVSNRSSFEDCFKKTVEAFGNIDILINNAGIFDEVNWERTLNVILTGTTHGCLLAINEFFPKYKSSDKTFIINVSSIGGLVPGPFGPHYHSAKYGVIGLTHSMGINKTHIRNGICIMSVCPASTTTTLQKNLIHREYFEEIRPQLIYQKAETVAKTVIEIINNPENGSSWVVSNSVMYKVKYPTLQDLINGYKKELS